MRLSKVSVLSSILFIVNLILLVSCNNSIVINNPAESESETSSGGNDTGEGSIPKRLMTRGLGTTGFDSGRCITTDSSGNIYVTGFTSGNLDGKSNAGLNDAFIAKYNASGVKQWVTLLGSSATDEASGIITDLSGNIYVTGFTSGNLDEKSNSGSYDVFIAKYNSSGEKQWVELLGTSAIDLATGITADSSGNIYIAGLTYGNLVGKSNAGSDDVFIAKYNPAGVKQWVTLVGSNSNEFGRAITYDASGYLYITGSTRGNLDGKSNSGSSDAFIAKFNTSGEKQWLELLGSSDNDQGNGITVTSSGDVFISGYTTGNLDSAVNAGGEDIFVAKYNSSGEKQWVNLLGTSSNDFSWSIASDSLGNVYATGYTGGNLDDKSNAGDIDMFIAKYKSNGTKLWIELYGGPFYESGSSIVTDSAANIYITGTDNGNIFLVTYGTDSASQ